VISAALNGLATYARWRFYEGYAAYGLDLSDDVKQRRMRLWLGAAEVARTVHQTYIDEDEKFGSGLARRMEGR
jgi:hypothetical protein